MTQAVSFSPVRRAFLRARSHVEPPLRPPWAVDEPIFLDMCNGCGACVAACPENVLVLGEGGYPTFDPVHGECLFCEACVTVCVPHALDKARVQPAWRLRAEIAPTCLTKNKVTCFSCRDACGEAAINFRPVAGGATLELDKNRCTGCGACVGVCPVAAISLTAPEARDG